MGGDILFDFFYSQMIGSFQRAHGRAENLRHLFVLHFIIILHVEDKTLFLGEGGDDLSEFQSQLVAVDRMAGAPSTYPSLSIRLTR